MKAQKLLRHRSVQCAAIALQRNIKSIYVKRYLYPAWFWIIILLDLRSHWLILLYRSTPEALVAGSGGEPRPDQTNGSLGSEVLSAVWISQVWLHP